ncbi:ABC transporter substrate-binding protein [Paenibacillus sepulcri]
MSAERAMKLGKSSDEIVVGAAWPFADRNDGFKEGLELALEEINQTGVIGSKIKLEQKDDLSSVTDGLTIAQNFSNDLNVTAVIGDRSSAVTVPASKVYEQAGVLFLAPTSTSPKLTEGGVSHIFRLIPNDTQIGAEMADYANSKMYKNIAVFYANDEYGRGLANSFEDSAKISDIQIIDRVSDYKDIDDLRRLVNKWNALGCDAVFVAEAMPDGANIILELRKAGLNLPVMGGDALDSDSLIEIGEKAVEGVVVASIFNPNDTDPKVRDFVESYKSRFGAEPNKYAAQAYDSLHLLAAAITEADSRKPADIAAALRKQETWPGVSGDRSFDASGDVNDMHIVMKQVKQGQFEYLK